MSEVVDPAVEDQPEAILPDYVLYLVDSALSEEDIATDDLLSTWSADLKLPEPKKKKKKKLKEPAPIVLDTVVTSKIFTITRSDLELVERTADDFECAPRFDEDTCAKLEEKIREKLALTTESTEEAPERIPPPNAPIHIILFGMCDVVADVIEIQKAVGKIRAHVILPAVPVIPKKKKKSKSDEPEEPEPKNVHLEIGETLQADIQQCNDPILENVVCQTTQIFEDASKKKGKPKWKVLSGEKLNTHLRTTMKTLHDSCEDYRRWRGDSEVFEFATTADGPLDLTEYQRVIAKSADDASISSVLRAMVSQIDVVTNGDVGSVVDGGDVNANVLEAIAEVPSETGVNDDEPNLMQYLDQDGIANVQTVLIDFDDSVMQRYMLDGFTAEQLEEQVNAFSLWKVPAVESYFKMNPKKEEALQNVELAQRYTFTKLNQRRFDHALICAEFSKLMQMYGLHTDEDEKISNRNWNIFQRKYIEDLQSNSMSLRLFSVLSNPFVELQSRYVSWNDSVLICAHVHTPQLRRRIFDQNCFLYPHVGYRFWRELPLDIRSRVPQLFYSHQGMDADRFLNKETTAFYPCDKSLFGLSSTSTETSLWILDIDAHARITPTNDGHNVFSSQFCDGTRVSAEWKTVVEEVNVDQPTPPMVDEATENPEETGDEEAATEQKNDDAVPTTTKTRTEGLIMTTLPNGTMIEYHLHSSNLFVYSDHDRVEAFLKSQQTQKNSEPQREAATDNNNEEPLEENPDAAATEEPKGDTEVNDESAADGNEEKDRPEIEAVVNSNPVEIWRCFHVDGHVTIQFSDGSQTRLLPDSSVWRRDSMSSLWLKVDQNGQRFEGDTLQESTVQTARVTDPESRSQVTTREDFVMQFRTYDGDRSIQFHDTSRIFCVSSKRWQTWDRHLLAQWMESVGVSVESARIFQNELKTDGNGFWALIPKLEEHITDANDRVVLQNGIEALRDERNEIWIERGDYPTIRVDCTSGEMNVICHENFRLELSPVGGRVVKKTGDSETQFDIHLSSEKQRIVLQPFNSSVEIPTDIATTIPKGLYGIDLMEGEIIIEDLEENRFCARLDGTSESSLFVERSIVADDEKDGDGETEVVDDKIPLKYFAPPRDPIQPRLFVIRRDGSGCEILCNEDFDRYSMLVECREDGTIVEPQGVTRDQEYPRSHQFLFRLKRQVAPTRSIDIPNVMRATLDKSRLTLPDKKTHNYISYRNIFEMVALTDSEVEQAVQDMERCENWRRELTEKDDQFQVQDGTETDNPQLSTLRESLFQQRAARLREKQENSRSNTGTFQVVDAVPDRTTPQRDKATVSRVEDEDEPESSEPRRSRLDQQLEDEMVDESASYFENPSFSRNFMLKELMTKVFGPLQGDENLQFDEEVTAKFSARLILFRKLANKIRLICSAKSQTPHEQVIFEKGTLMHDLYILDDVEPILSPLMQILGFMLDTENNAFVPVRTRMYLEGGAAEIDAELDALHSRFKRKITENLGDTASTMNIQEMFGSGSQYFPHPNSPFIMQSGAIDAPVTAIASTYANPHREETPPSVDEWRRDQENVSQPLATPQSIMGCPECKKSLCSCCARDEHERAKYVTVDGEDRSQFVNIEELDTYQPSASYEYNVDRIELEAPTQSRLKTSSTYATSLFPESVFGTVKITPQRIEFGKVVFGATYRFCATISNIGNYSTRFRVVNPDPIPEVHLDMFYRPGSLAPGMTSPLEIELKMQRYGPLSVDLTVKTQKLVFTIPIVAEATNDMRFLTPQNPLCHLSEGPPVPEETQDEE